jgi:hypothetical protein
LVKFGLQDVLEPQDVEVEHVGEVGHGHGQVVLHTKGLQIVNYFGRFDYNDYFAIILPIIFTDIVD